MLEEKVAVITGSARGIGRATAEQLAELGANVVIADLDGGAATATAKEIEGPTAVFCGDLTEAGEPERLIATAIEAFGRIDIVVNNAGYPVDAPIHKMTDVQFQEMLDLHSVLPFRVLRAAAPYLREPAKQEREAGKEVFRKVVNISSIAGTMGNAGQSSYSSGKAAVVGLTKTLAKEWGPLKINVNAVAFGFIDTRLTAPKGDDNVLVRGGRAVALGIPEQTRATAPMLIPLGRPGTAREAASAVTFLCTPWSDYVQGQVLNVTGGIGMGMDS